MSDVKPPSEPSHQEGSTPKDAEGKAATIAVALAAAAERMKPVAGTGIPVVQRSTDQAEARASTEAASQIESALRTTTRIDAKE